MRGVQIPQIREKTLWEIAAAALRKRAAVYERCNLRTLGRKMSAHCVRMGPSCPAPLPERLTPGGRTLSLPPSDEGGGTASAVTEGEKLKDCTKESLPPVRGSRTGYHLKCNTRKKEDSIADFV